MKIIKLNKKMKKIKIKEKIEPKILAETLDIIKSKLPKKAEILCLSLTGSRAFGWADERMDYDIHGVFVAKNYWDWVHSGEKGMDINLHELTYVLNYLPTYLHFEFFQNNANFIYLHPKFNYKELMSFCLPSKIYAPTRELKELELNFYPRAALHCYRILMVPIYFLKNRKFELDIFKINKKYKFKMLPILKDRYLGQAERPGRELDEKEKRVIKKDLEKLLNEFEKLKEKFKDEEIDNERLEKWKKKTIKTFYGQ